MENWGKLGIVVAAAIGCGPVHAQVGDDARPVAPAGAVASLVLPPRGTDGAFATPNRQLTAAETVWHLRTALNVAALGCRGPGEAEMVAGYNAVLAGARQPLAEASVAVAATYRTRFGALGGAKFDDDMTRLYNFWAQPGAHDAFCAVAETVLRDAATAEPGDFEGFATAALPRLEAPFLAFFGEVAAYRTALAQWEAARTSAPTQVAAVQLASNSVAGVRVASNQAPAPRVAVTQVSAMVVPTRFGPEAP